MSISAYPLCWPPLFPRSKSTTKGNFATTLPKALANVEKSLQLFGQDSKIPVKDVVLSSNVTLGKARPQDPGIAVWFTWDGQQVCIPVDRYDTAEANLQAIHHIIEARRTELRHGTLALVRATFQGFKALPAPGGDSARGWRTVLGFDEGERPDLETVEARYRKMAAAAHPDRPGGTVESMTRLNEARDQARREIGA